MRRTLLTALSLAAVPTIALAAFMQPSELLSALQFKGQPLDITYDLHAQLDEKTYASAWLRGSMQGSDIQSAVADLRMTIHVNLEGELMRAKTQMRIRDQMLYMRIEGIDSTLLPYYGNPESIGQWYAMSLTELEDEYAEEKGITEESATQLAADVINTIFSLDRTDTTRERTYSIRLKRNAAAALQKESGILAKKYPKLGLKPMTNKEMADMRRILSRVNLHIKTVTDLSDAPKSIKYYLAMRYQEMHGVLIGMITFRSTDVRVLVPANTQYIPTPQKQLSEALDAQRRSDINTIFNAVNYYVIVHGELPPGIPVDTPTEICQIEAPDCDGFVDLSPLVGESLIQIPWDPLLEEGQRETGFFIWQDQDGFITVESTKGTRTLRVPAGEESFESLNPYELKDARDAQRRSDINTIMNAVYQSAIDNSGELPPGISDTPTELCQSEAADCTGFLDLYPFLEDYLVRMPYDPELETGQPETGYRIWQDRQGRLTVEALHPESTSAIIVTR